MTNLLSNNLYDKATKNSEPKKLNIGRIQLRVMTIMELLTIDRKKIKEKFFMDGEQSPKSTKQITKGVLDAMEKGT